MRKIRHQPRVKGGRAHIAPCILHSIEEEVRRLANLHGVSKSWVVSTILADAFRIKEQPSFVVVKERKLRRVK